MKRSEKTLRFLYEGVRSELNEGAEYQREAGLRVLCCFD